MGIGHIFCTYVTTLVRIIHELIGTYTMKQCVYADLCYSFILKHHLFNYFQSGNMNSQILSKQNPQTRQTSVIGSLPPQSISEEKTKVRFICYESNYVLDQCVIRAN